MRFLRLCVEQGLEFETVFLADGFLELMDTPMISRGHTLRPSCQSKEDIEEVIQTSLPHALPFVRERPPFSSYARRRAPLIANRLYYACRGCCWGSHPEPLGRAPSQSLPREGDKEVLEEGMEYSDKAWDDHSLDLCCFMGASKVFRILLDAWCLFIFLFIRSLLILQYFSFLSIYHIMVVHDKFHHPVAFYLFPLCFMSEY